MKITVTGGSGFIGNQLVKQLLENGNLVQVLTRSKDKFIINDPNLEVIESSLNIDNNIYKKIEIFDPNILIHLSWEGIPDYSLNMSYINLINNISFFEKIKKLTNIKKVIVTGSCWEYEKRFGICCESDLEKSSSYFVWSKRSIYEYLKILYENKDVILIWARIFYVYGPMQRKASLIPYCIDSIINNNKIKINHPLNSNDFIYIDDVVDGIEKFVNIDIASGIYNIGTGKSTKIKDIINIVKYNLGFKSDIFDSYNLNETITEDFWADMTKTSKKLNWIPSITIQEGINKIINQKLFIK
jgi:nucleoside-diphosphate-sugar epimerase